MITERKIFANNIKNTRKSLNITQEDLADNLNLDVRTIRKWENVESFPSIENLVKLAKAFNVKVSYFFKGI